LVRTLGVKSGENTDKPVCLSHSVLIAGQITTRPGPLICGPILRFAAVVIAMTSPAPLPILCFPDPRLHTVAKPVAAVDARIRELIERMFATMYEANGIGLAATQVDVHERLVVIDVSETRDQRLVLINPEIEWASPETRKGEEGCLSVPGIYDGVERSVAVRVRAQDADGNLRTIEAQDMLAVCIQHEMDHLLGKVFVEYLSPLKRNRIKSKLLKAQREAERD
jgi:peptide deformylase